MHVVCMRLKVLKATKHNVFQLDSSQPRTCIIEHPCNLGTELFTKTVAAHTFLQPLQSKLKDLLTWLGFMPTLNKNYNAI